MVEKNSIDVVNIKIELELDELENVKQILGNIDKGSSIRIYDDEAELTILSADDSLSFDGGVILEFLLTFSVNVAAGVLGNYIYNLCKRGKKLTLNHRRTRITEESIKQAITQNIEAETTTDEIVNEEKDLSE